MEEESKMENSEILFLSKNFLNYRSINDEDQLKLIEFKDETKRSFFNDNNKSMLGVDSAYHSNNSYLSTTPHSSTLSSSQFSTFSSSVNSTKSLSHQQLNYLDAIYEHSSNKNDCLTLTPVTQNAQRISAFHITTPKNGQQFHCINKRSSNFSLEEFQSTPKKLKICDLNVYSTPQKHKKKKISLFQRLHSAPDFENNNKEDEIELWKTPAQSTPKRTPLQPIQQMAHSSTPINVPLNYSRRNTVRTPMTKINENSLNDLLNCSNDVFESILNSDSLSSPKNSKNGSRKKLRNLQNNENDFQPNANSCFSDTNNRSACKTFRRFLKFNSQNNTVPILQDKSKSDFKIISIPTLVPNKRKNYPAIHSVIHDRLKAKKRVNAERLANLNRENYLDNLHDEINANTHVIENELVGTRENNINADVDLKRIDMGLSPAVSLDMDISTTDIQAIDMDISPGETNLKKKFERKNLNNSRLILIESEIKNDATFDDFIPLTPPPYKAEEEIEILENHLTNEVLNLKQKKSPAKTPSRNSSRSSSTSSPKSSLYDVDKEKFQILYPTIPETPKKNFKPISPKKSPKRNKKLITKTKKNVNRAFYNGSTYLNIIAKLESYTIVLEKIFQCLSDKDLLNLSMTTKVYRIIIHDNYKANLRLIQFKRNWQVSKENYCKQSHLDRTDKSDSIRKDNKYNKVKPFSLHNEKLPFKRDSTNELRRRISLETSPPVSPTERKFHEYQKIIKNLTDEQNMAKCPRCAMASRIIKQVTLNSFPGMQSTTENFETVDSQNNNINETTDYNFNNNYKCENHTKLTQSQALRSTSEYQPAPSDFRRSSLITQCITQQGKMKLTKAYSVDSFQGQLKRQRLLQEISKFQPYGECTSFKCKFKYCLECFCDYHPNQKCKLTQSVSPSKEDIQNGILQIIKSPKNQSGYGSRNLNTKRKSLKRLCFN